MPPAKPKPDQDCSREELVAKLVTSRELYKKLRDEKNAVAADLIKAEADVGAARELLALVRREKEELAEVVRNAGKDSRLVGMVGKLRAELAEATQTLVAVGQILDGDQPMNDLPDHPLLTTAEEVAAIAGTRVSWRRVAGRRLELLDELIVRYEAADGRPSDPEWVRLLNRIRTELLERVDLPDDDRSPQP